MCQMIYKVEVCTVNSINLGLSGMVFNVMTKVYEFVVSPVNILLHIILRKPVGNLPGST
jgi:hypothetical protein